MPNHALQRTTNEDAMLYSLVDEMNSMNIYQGGIMTILDKILSVFGHPKVTLHPMKPIEYNIRCPKCGYCAYYGDITQARTTVSCCGHWFAFDTSDGAYDATKRFYD